MLSGCDGNGRKDRKGVHVFVEAEETLRSSTRLKMLASLKLFECLCSNVTGPFAEGMW